MTTPDLVGTPSVLPTERFLVGVLLAIGKTLRDCTCERIELAVSLLAKNFELLYGISELLPMLQQVALRSAIAELFSEGHVPRDFGDAGPYPNSEPFPEDQPTHRNLIGNLGVSA
jgi:hypothetical protein